MAMKRVFRMTESDLRGIIRESIERVIDERFEITDETPYDDFARNNQDKHLVIFDDDYKCLQDLVDGVKRHELLIHCRRVEDGSLENLRWGLEPTIGETIMDTYGPEYQNCYDSEYYPEDEYGKDYWKEQMTPMVFASDDLKWCGESRNGVIFVKSDGFRRKSPDTWSDGRSGSEMDMIYDLDNGEFSDPYDDGNVPIYVEAGDYFSEDTAEVVAVLNLNGTVK